ncbi:diguanylate cyclase [Sulfurimonas sp.]
MDTLDENVIFNTVDNGIIILDDDLTVLNWNRWLEIFTKRNKKDIVGKKLSDLFGYINTKRLNRKIKSVLTTKSSSYYSVDPHKYLIEIPISKITNKYYTQMQQKVTIVPYNLEKKQVCIYIYDETSVSETNLKLNKANEELLELSHRDPLTCLFNRRYFSDQLEKVKSFALRNKHPISMIILDIDDFKKINDTYGHAIGDEVIITMAKTLEDVVRKSDIVVRFGGEEFVILLQNIDLEKGYAIAEKLRIAVENLEVKSFDNQSIKFTSSFGVAQFSETLDNDSLEQTLSRADEALYKAKKSGKNKVITA